MYQRAIDIALQAEGAHSRTAVRLRSTVANYMIGLNRHAEARPYIDAALSSLRASGGAGEIQAAVMSSEYWATMFETDLTTRDEPVATIERNRALLAAQQGIPPTVRARVDMAFAYTLTQRGELLEARRVISPSASILKAASSQDLGTRSQISFVEGLLAMNLGQHVAADALLREHLALAQKLWHRDPGMAYPWGWVAINLIMKRDHEQAQRILELAPKFGALKGDPSVYAEFFPLVLPALSARLLLERGDIRGALSAMPALPPNYMEGETLLAEHALNGEILCAAGRAAEGLPELLASIKAVSAHIGEIHPGLARIRAAAGLCALALGDAAQAKKLAEQARQAFIAQPEVSPYFKAPLAKLERALQARRPGS
jgi:eukaryotic-like serine/threonine-protein kinase